jgi:hypothetical protein
LRADTAAAISVRRPAARCAVIGYLRPLARVSVVPGSRVRVCTRLCQRAPCRGSRTCLSLQPSAVVVAAAGCRNRRWQGWRGRRQARAGRLRRRALALRPPALGADAAPTANRNSAPQTATTGAHAVFREGWRSRSCRKTPPPAAQASAAALARSDTHTHSLTHAHAHTPGSEDAAILHRGSSRTLLSPQGAGQAPPQNACSVRRSISGRH